MTPGSRPRESAIALLVTFVLASGAVLAQMVHEAGGVDAVREYLRTPGRGMEHVLERLLKHPWPAIADAWRQRVDRMAAT